MNKYIIKTLIRVVGREVGWVKKIIFTKQQKINNKCITQK